MLVQSLVPWAAELESSHRWMAAEELIQIENMGDGGIRYRAASILALKFFDLIMTVIPCALNHETLELATFFFFFEPRICRFARISSQRQVFNSLISLIQADFHCSTDPV
jgi:hypothetical protein